MASVHSLWQKIRDFYALAQRLDDAYLQHITAHNAIASMLAAWLIILLECGMAMRLLISHPAVDTPASRVYLMFYLSLIMLAALYLILQSEFVKDPKRVYWLQFCCTGVYLLWNMLLNTYDLHRNGRGSCLALITALIFAAVLLYFRPHHMMALQLCTFAVFYALNEARIEDKINASIAVLVAVVINLILYTRNIQSVDRIQRLTQTYAHLRREQMDGAMQYVSRLQDAQTQTSIYRHDMRHTLSLVEQLALQGNIEKLQAFVSDSQKRLTDVTPVFYCEHEIANLILGSFAQRAAQAHTAFAAETQLPKNIALADTDLCALLSNLLENALHGTENIEDGALRRIYIKAIVRENQLAILVENGFAGNVVMKDGRPLSQSNEDNHGFGVQSVINIVERHQGFYLFEPKGSLFKVQLLLNLPEQGQPSVNVPDAKQPSVIQSGTSPSEV